MSLVKDSLVTMQVISAAGAVTHEDIVEQVKLNFVKLSANPYTSSQLIAANPGRFIGSEVYY